MTVEHHPPECDLLAKIDFLVPFLWSKSPFLAEVELVLNFFGGYFECPTLAFHGIDTVWVYTEYAYDI
jgi:hypothetical protein